MLNLLNVTVSLFEKNFTSQVQIKIWGDPMGLRRAAYYQASRALVSQSLKYPPAKIDPIRLWHGIYPGKT